MSFNILSKIDNNVSRTNYSIYSYASFRYKTKWVTEITHVKDKKYFVDEQRFGPYSLWHHKHFIKEVKGGVEMEDIIDYKVPLGILGQMVHPLLVKPKLEEIFAYRQKKLLELFGEYK